jgi:hypothetical protein
MVCRSEGSAFRLLMAALTAVATTACGDDRAAVECIDVDGVVVIDELPVEPETVRYSELWRIGGSHEDEHLGFPLAAAVSDEGRVAIADFQLGDLFIIEANGGWYGSIASRGAGPGELNTPVAAVWDATGGLHVFDIGKPAVLSFAADLSYAGEVPVPAGTVADILASGELGWAGLQPSGALLLQPGYGAAAGGAEVREALLRYPPGASTPDTLAVTSFPVVSAANAPTTAVPGWPRLSASVGVDGRTIVGGTSHAYRFVVIGPAGETELRACAEQGAAPLSRTERGGDPPQYMEALGAAFAATPSPPRPAALGRVIAGADGTIWIQRDRRFAFPDDNSIHGVPGALYDVFAADGRHIRTLRLPPRARLQGALGDTIWAYEIGEFDDISFVAYRIGAPDH